MVTHHFYRPFATRKIKLIPTGWNQHIAMYIEVLGCKGTIFLYFQIRTFNPGFTLIRYNCHIICLSYSITHTFFLSVTEGSYILFRFNRVFRYYKIAQFKILTGSERLWNYMTSRLFSLAGQHHETIQHCQLARQLFRQKLSIGSFGWFCNFDQPKLKSR